MVMFQSQWGMGREGRATSIWEGLTKTRSLGRRFQSVSGKIRADWEKGQLLLCYRRKGRKKTLRKKVSFDGRKAKT